MIVAASGAYGRLRKSRTGVGVAVLAAAEARFRSSPYPCLHRITCSWHDGVLTLQGRVPSYYLKQIAQTLVIAMMEGLKVNNELVVGPAGEERK